MSSERKLNAILRADVSVESDGEESTGELVYGGVKDAETGEPVTDKRYIAIGNDNAVTVAVVDVADIESIVAVEK